MRHPSSKKLGLERSAIAACFEKVATPRWFHQLSSGRRRKALRSLNSGFTTIDYAKLTRVSNAKFNPITNLDQFPEALPLAFLDLHSNSGVHFRVG